MLVSDSSWDAVRLYVLRKFEKADSVGANTVATRFLSDSSALTLGLAASTAAVNVFCCFTTCGRPRRARAAHAGLRREPS